MSSKRELLRVDQPFVNHNGGLLLFGPTTATSTSDSAMAAMAATRCATARTTPRLGKILRIDPKPDGDLPYTVPKDNPFAGDPDKRGEIFASGLRNPWRFSFDPATGNLLDRRRRAGGEQEEVDVVTSEQANGANFGWSAFEGTPATTTTRKRRHPPALVAQHADGNCSITGGVVVHDPDLPTLSGRYVWGDFCLGELRSFTRSRRRRRPTTSPSARRSTGWLASFGTDNAERLRRLEQRSSSAPGPGEVDLRDPYASPTAC